MRKSFSKPGTESSAINDSLLISVSAKIPEQVTNSEEQTQAVEL